MKTFVFSLLGFAAFSLTAPAYGDEPALQLGVGGYVEAYAVYTDQDEAPATDLRQFDFRKYSEVHLSGETTLDNGVTAGARIEMSVDRADGASTLQESYFFLSGRAGKVNIGEEDGAAHLLQVEAPSGDELVDGVRPHIGTITAANGGNLNYAHDDYGYSNKVTYITPSYDGLQMAVSYTPSANDADVNGITPALSSNDGGLAVEQAWEMAARYEQNFDAIDIVLGAGYSRASQEIENGLEDDLVTWNAGGVLGWNDAHLGVAYLTTNNGSGGTAPDDDTDTLVVGVDYQLGATKLGGSYLTQTNANLTNDQEITRWTVGAVHQFAPGMTLRGAAQMQEAENIGGVAGADGEATQILLGSQVNF